jgi:hypothetical protein
MIGSMEQDYVDGGIKKNKNVSTNVKLGDYIANSTNGWVYVFYA